MAIAANPRIAPTFQAGMTGRAITEAPVPAAMSPGLRARRRQAPVAPAVNVSPGGTRGGGRTMAPMAAAQAAYQETGDPFSAFASGWINASTVREEDAAAEAKRAEIASAFQAHPDLAKYIESGAMEPADALRIKESREAATKKTEAAAARKAEIGQTLSDLAAKDPKYAKIAEQWGGGLLDEDGLSKALSEVDKVATPTDDQRELQQINEERAAAGKPALSMEEFKTPAAKPPDVFGNEKDLYQQYSNSDPVKTYETVKTSYERLKESAAQQSGAGDMGLIYGYMKMLDPGSVVRESEFAMAAQAGDFGEQVQGMVSRLLNGERLPEAQRQEFLKNAEGLYAESAANLTDINTQFEERAKGAGVDPSRFIRKPEAYAPISGGGGDPALSDMSDEDLLKQLNQ